MPEALDIGVGEAGHLFGRPCSFAEATWVVLPVPWALTASGKGGAEHAPEAILSASPNIDYALPQLEASLDKLAVHMLPISLNWKKKHHELRPFVESYGIALQKEGASAYSKHRFWVKHIDEVCKDLRLWVQEQIAGLLQAKKSPVLLGGEHSLTAGAIDALLPYAPDMAILQLDAHMDLRPNYMGWTHSHASVMRNLLIKHKDLHLVQVGVREYSREESLFAESLRGRVRTFYAEKLYEAYYKGKSWHNLCLDIIKPLPEKVYLSLDIDVLSPSHAPHTGTPALGGIDYNLLGYLIKQLACSGRKIMGMDLVEVVPDPRGHALDESLASQLLYRMCAWAAFSRGQLA